jgi:cytochrome c oxidase subunit 1
MTSVPYIPSYESGGTATSGEVPQSYLNSRYSVWSWIFTKDHKRICILYMLSISFFFLIGGAAATIMRIELMSPHGWLMSDDVYNKMFTTHGVMMVFFFLIPSIPATLGNFLIPLMIGAKDLAFPKVNLLSWYLYMSGGTLAFIALVAGGIDTGWTFYTPYSTTYADGWVTLTLFGIFLNGFSSILTGLNFLVSIHKMRAPGMTWFRLPLFIWSMYATSVIFILGTPVVAIALSLVIFERVFGLGIFDPALGGDPVLFQHMFWFYSHPAVYIMILPSMGVVSEIIACFSRKKVFGYEMVAFSSLAIAIIGFLVWGHHMFLTSQSVYSGMVFSILSFLVGIPSAIKVFNWTTTMYKGSVDLKTPMLYALGFVGLFTLGGLTGLFLACMGMDIHLHDTYFIIAHFHYIMVGGALMGYMGGLHFWWPKITGKLYNEWLGRCAAITLFIGFNVTFFPQFILGYLGMPRRYHTYPEEFQMLNVLSTAGASVMAVGYILPLFYLIYSLKYGKAAGPNPYTATGLEWTTQSPPLTENFLETPIVTQEAYAYAEMEIKGVGTV